MYLCKFQAEKLLQKDGDFLVRQSSIDPNQYVLSGKQNGMIKHLLLVDPDGVVSFALLSWSIEAFWCVIPSQSSLF